MKIRLSFIAVAISVVLLNSCNKDGVVNPELQDDKNYVSKYEAEELASMINTSSLTNNDDPSKKNAISSQRKYILSVNTVVDDEGKDAFHIVNYTQGGFVILSADRRVAPILAYSDTHSFEVKEEQLPLGLKKWVNNTKVGIKKKRKSKSSQSEKVKKQWDEILGRLAPDPETDPIPDDPETCETSHISAGPLLTTTWNQQGGFNDRAPITGCTNDIDGRALAGCVPVAMGQIMNFYHFPANYNWNNVANTVGTIETATLLRDIGDAVQANYGCGNNGDGGTGASPTELVSSFTQDFGFSSATSKIFNYRTARSYLNLNRPLVLYAWSDQGGHAWVCDGYVQTVTCNATYLPYFHMKWGWLNGSGDGYYLNNDWSPGEIDFSNGQSMVIAIP